MFIRISSEQGSMCDRSKKFKQRFTLTQRNVFIVDQLGQEIVDRAQIAKRGFTQSS